MLVILLQLLRKQKSGLGKSQLEMSFDYLVHLSSTNANIVGRGQI